jgi:diguanylate cyclase (GGDEF)-like protein
MPKEEFMLSKGDRGSLERKVFDFFTLSQLGKSLISIQDMENLARVFASAVYETSDAKNVALLIFDIEEKAFTYQYSIGLEVEKVKDVSFVEEEGLFWRVLNGAEPFPIKDSAGNYHFPRVIQKFRLDLLQSQIWVPLMVKNVLRGVLTLGAKKDDSSYGDAELVFISQLATQGAIAIDSALLDQQKQRATLALGKKMENLSVLYDVSKALNFVNDFKKTLLLILDKARTAVHAQKGSIMLLNKDTQELEVKVVRGIDPITEKKINDGEMECTKIKVGEGIAGKVAASLQHMVVEEARRDARFKQSASSNVENIICLPLLVGNDCLGVMNITNKVEGGKFTEEDVELLLTLAGQVAVTINNANLYHLAITDGLTQLFINRYFRQRLHDELIRARRYNHPLSLIMSDIDHFKKFNDTYGHQQGDAVLATTAKLFKTTVRETDIACRYGGEEFAIVLPETPADGAAVLAEKLRQAIEQYEYPGLKGDKLKVTVSLGIADFPQHGQSEEEIIEKADVALYACKEAGRNCARIYAPGMKKEKGP